MKARLIEGKTIPEWVKISGISGTTIRRRLNGGMDPASAVREEPISPRLIDGKTVAEWVKISGISEGTIRQRLRDGMDPANAVREEPNSEPRRSTRLIDGKTVAEWSKISGIHIDTVNKRLREGMDPSEAVRKEPHRPQLIEGKTIPEWSKISGINDRTIHRRLIDGMDPSEAVRKEAFLLIEGKSVPEWSEISGITKGTIRQRLREGMDPADAVREECFPGGFDVTKPAILYYLRISTPDGMLYKIGVTNRTVEYRYSKRDHLLFVEIFSLHFEVGQDAYDLEQEIIHEHKADQYKGGWRFSCGTGSRELFTRDVLEQDKRYSLHKHPFKFPDLPTYNQKLEWAVKMLGIAI